MSTTASPRLYWLRRQEGQPPIVEVITEAGRHPLKLFPFALRSDGDQYLWGQKGAGTKILAMAILWDVFQDREIVTKFYRKFSDDVLEDVRASVANVVPIGLVLNWFQEENEGRLRMESRAANCGGCPQ